MNKSEQLIACLEGEIAKRDARIVELESAAESLRLSRDYHREQEIEYRRRWAGLYAAPVQQVSMPASAFASRAITHYEAALLAAFPSGSSGEVFNQWNEARRVLYAAPSTAGVGGLEVYITDCATCVDVVPAKTVTDAKVVLARDAQAIIDGPRGENERIRLNIAEYNEAIACYQSERDQQAQRIGELEGLLRHAQKQIPTGSGLHMRIDAAISAGKGVE